jgi:hypothetical protein
VHGWEATCTDGKRHALTCTDCTGDHGHQKCHQVTVMKNLASGDQCHQIGEWCTTPWCSEGRFPALVRVQRVCKCRARQVFLISLPADALRLPGLSACCPWWPIHAVRILRTSLLFFFAGRFARLLLGSICANTGRRKEQCINWEELPSQ